MKKLYLLALLPAALGVLGVVVSLQIGASRADSSFLDFLQQNRAFDTSTNSRLATLSKEGATITDDDLRWATGLLKGKPITNLSDRMAFQQCARVLIARHDIPSDLRDAYKSIGTEMVNYRKDVNEHHMVALTGCVLLSRTKDPAVASLMQPLLNDPDPDYRKRVQRAINELSKTE